MIEFRYMYDDLIFWYYTGSTNGCVHTYTLTIFSNFWNNYENVVAFNIPVVTLHMGTSFKNVILFKIDNLSQNTVYYRSHLFFALPELFYFFIKITKNNEKPDTATLFQQLNQGWKWKFLHVFLNISPVTGVLHSSGKWPGRVPPVYRWPASDPWSLLICLWCTKLPPTAAPSHSLCICSPAGLRHCLLCFKIIS